MLENTSCTGRNMFKTFSTMIEQKPYILAIVISLSLVGWMATGDEKSSLPHKDPNNVQIKIPNVEITLFSPQSVTRNVQVYGRTEPYKVLALKTEIEGKIDTLHVREGQSVKKGDLVATLALYDKEQQVRYANALVEQRTTEFKAAKTIYTKGLSDESQYRQAQSALELAKANLEQAKFLYEKSFVRAPFSGVINARHVEAGSFVSKAQTLFELVDLTPLIVRASVTEKHIDKLNKNNQVEVRLANGDLVKGKIEYIASYSTQGTNTFPVEVSINNTDMKMKAGVSTEMTIMFEPESAIKVSPALMSLDKDGNIGVKTVVDNTVMFTPIDLIKAEKDGVWLAGFEGQTQVITLGQGFVRPGDQVTTSIKQ